MPRIRTIKPEFWGDEKLSVMDPLTRLVFLGLVSMADDAGRLVDNVKQLDGQLFPSTADTCETALEVLASASRILRYRSTSGQDLIQITNWARHQRVDHPNRHTLPAPPTPPKRAKSQTPVIPIDRPPLASASRDPRATTLDLGPTTLDQRPATLEPGPTSEAAADAGPPDPDNSAAAAHLASEFAGALTAAANRAIIARWGPQPRPLHAGAASQLSIDLVRMDVDLEVACEAIAAVMARSKLPQPPRAMEYFREIIVEAHRAAEHQQFRSTDHDDRRGGSPARVSTVLTAELEQQRRDREREYELERHNAAVAWSQDPANKSAFESIVAAANLQFADLLRLQPKIGTRGRDLEVVIRSAEAAGFPSLEEWMRHATAKAS